ncbi:hypothetical protein QEN19_003468 [Hanseniaspora menglaensis]
MSQNNVIKQQISSNRINDESIITLTLQEYVQQRSNLQEVFHLTEQSDLSKTEEKALQLKEEFLKLK